MKTQWVREGIAPLFLTSALDGGEWTVLRLGIFVAAVNVNLSLVLPDKLRRELHMALSTTKQGITARVTYTEL
jgi:hypothetical protein